MPIPTTLRVYYGAGTVREGLNGVDLSGFPQATLVHLNGENARISSVLHWLIRSFSLDPEVCSVVVQGLWSRSPTDIRWELRTMLRTATWKGFVQGCRCRGYECVLLVQPCALEAVEGHAYDLALGGASNSGGPHVGEEEEVARDEADAMPEAEWNDENTRIICELFAEQVQAGNRPTTHLNNIGYSQVASKFQQRTQLLYTKKQLKNKWDKLKSDYSTWKKLLIRGEGLGWNNARGTTSANDDWWKKTNKELPGASRFRKAGMQNEDYLRVMFDDITSNGVDHLPLVAGSLPSGPDSPMDIANLDGSDNNVEDNDGTQLDHEPPSNRNNKRPIYVNAKKNKKNKIETALLMQAQLKHIAELAEKAQSTFEKFASQVDSPGSSIQDVMTLVRECGAAGGSDEHFIATELFVNREQREMFLTIATAEGRLEWLKRKYTAKYGT